MRLIKLAFISFLVFAGIFFLISLFLPSGYSIVNSVTVAAPVEKVAPYLEDLSGWKEWNLLTGKDAEYFSNEIKIENISITKEPSEDNTVSTLWHSEKRKFTSAIRYFPDAENPEVTTIQWMIQINTKWYPWEKFASMIFDKQIDRPMQSSLDSLKNLIQQQ